MDDPHLGESVYYLSYGTPNGEFKSVPRAAIVTAIHGDGFVDLCVINPTGMFFNQNVSQGEKPGQWTFPPSIEKG